MRAHIFLSLFLYTRGNSPIYGGLSDFGYYFVDVLVGSPPQRMSAILDTGSEGLLVACSTCTSCGAGHMDPFFNPSVSESFSRLPECPASNLRNPECTFEKRYLEGSLLKGKVFNDVVSVSKSAVAKRTNFGCIEKETKLFLEQKANGIFGLAPLSKTDWLFGGSPSVNSFSVCLAREGGDILFHAGDTLTRPDTSIPLSYLEGHYVVSPSSISVGQDWMVSAGNISTYVGAEVLVDSGSTITYFTDKLYRVIFERIQKSISHLKLQEDTSGPAVCLIVEGKEEVQTLLPIISISFQGFREGQVISATFSNYTYSVSGKECLTIASNAGLDRTDLGASWMIGKNITFSSSSGWMQIDPSAACTNRSISQRRPVEPVEGQLNREPEYSVAAMVGLVSIMFSIGVVLFFITRRSIAATRYQPVIEEE
jgi:hypothetical protein